MEEEEGNFSRHIGQIAQANGQCTTQDFGMGEGRKRIKEEIPSPIFNSVSTFLRKVRLVIYWVVLGFCTLDFIRNLFVNGRMD